MTENVDGNFQRLEEEVNRLLEVLEQFRSENSTMRERAAEAQQEIEGLQGRLAQAEEEQRRAAERNRQARERLEGLLSRLEAVDS